MCRKAQKIVEEESVEDNNDSPELTRMEIEMAKQNFNFYCQQKKGEKVHIALEYYELPMILSACGYKCTAAQHDQLAEFLLNRKGGKMDFAALVAVLTQLKRLELAADDNNEGDEYLDAFVALGGQPDKGGYVEKNMLIEIIKNEFELTIDMVVSSLLVS